MSKTLIELPTFEGFDYSWIDSEFDNIATSESEYFAEEYNLSDTRKAHEDLEGRKIIGPALLIPNE